MMYVAIGFMIMQELTTRTQKQKRKNKQIQKILQMVRLYMLS
jgi:hypothetical protein